MSVSIARMRHSSPRPVENVLPTGGHEDGRVVRLAVLEPEQEAVQPADRRTSPELEANGITSWLPGGVAVFRDVRRWHDRVLSNR
jgi:hypothetical protein